MPEVAAPLAGWALQVVRTFHVLTTDINGLDAGALVPSSHWMTGPDTAEEYNP